MRVDVSFKYMERSEFIDNVLEKDLEKIERRIKIYKHIDPIHISVHIEKNPHRQQYFCRSHIYLPAHLLKAQEEADKAALAINKTFAALSKQLDKLKVKVERHLGRR